MDRHTHYYLNMWMQSLIVGSLCANEEVLSKVKIAYYSVFSNFTVSFPQGNIVSYEPESVVPNHAGRNIELHCVLMDLDFTWKHILLRNRI